MKFNKVIFPVLFVLFGIFIISFGLISAEIINPFGLSDVVNVGSFNSLGLKSNVEIIDELVADKNTETKKSVPDEINGLWIDFIKDFDFPENADVNEIKSYVYNDLLFYKNFLPNAFFIKPDFSGKYDNLIDENGNKFDLLKYLIDLLQQGSANVFIVIDEALVFDSNNELSSVQLNDKIKDYNFDGILFSCNNSENIDLVGTVEYLSLNIRKNFAEAFFGVEVHSDYEAQFADDSVIALCEKKTIDFIYLDLLTSTADVEYPFFSVAMWWNYFADYYDIPLYCEHRLDKIFGGDDLWAYSNEINLQLTALYNAHAFDGSCFYNASQLKTKKALARDLSIFLNDVAGTSQDDFYVSSLTLGNNKVTFTAETAVDDILLFCNDEPVRTENNLMRKDFVLHNGMNIFSFRGNAADYDFQIYNNLSLIYSCSPNKDNSFVEGDSLVCYTVCPENAEVYVIFNGNYYAMQPDVNLSNDIPFGYCTYSVSVDLTGEKSVSDLLSYLCILGNESETVHLNVSFSDKKVYHTDIPSERTNKLSPYTNNGLGNALMCVIKDNHTETVSEVNDYDTYHPYRSKILKDTVDYVDKINISAEGYIRYELKSGLNVYADDAVLISHGFVMPENNVKFINYDALNEKLQFSLDWLSPVNLVLDELDYKVGYEQFSYNVSEFNAEYIDVNVHYCKNFSNIELLDLKSSELFSAYEIIDTEDNVVTLRLFFRSPGKFFGYDISHNEGIIEICFKNPASVNSDKVIMLDAGHGGISMIGTALNDNSASEAQITLAIAYKTKVYLESKGYKVIMTRTDDIPLNLSERMSLCENFSPDLFVSIHCDGSDSYSESGTHTFYYTPYSQPLADSIHNKIVSTYLNDIYVEADSNYANVDRKIKYYPFYVTRVDNCPSVLIETGFLTNLVEGNVLVNPINQELIANSIAEGICSYFDKIK